MSDSTHNVAASLSKPGTLGKTFSAVAKFARTQGRESSTWRGLVLIISACGVALRPEAGEALIALGLAISGLIAVLTTDAPVVPPQE